VLPGTATGAGGPGAATGGSGAAASAARILSGALGLQPRTDLGWAPGGTLHPETLAALRAGGISRVVVAGAALTDGSAALGMTAQPATAPSTIPLPSAPLAAFVGDTLLGDLAGSTGQATADPRLAEQRYLAELTVLGLQSGEDPTWGATVLVTPPREVDADPAGVAAMMSDTGALPWLRAASVTQLAAAPAGDTGGLAAPTPNTGLDAAGLADVSAAVAVRQELASAVTDRSSLDSYDAAIARVTSVSWRGHPRQFRDAAAALRGDLQDLLGRVTLLAPASGTYSLASSDSPVVLTVRNDLPFPVRVRLQLKSRGNMGLTTGDIGVQELAPRSRTTLQVPTHVHQSGRFLLTATLTTPDGGALGDRVQFQVKSTTYGPISLGITIGAAALLALLFLRRLLRFVLRRRRAARAPGEALPEPDAEGTVAPPPARSPV
jgi:hypothetical protein